MKAFKLLMVIASLLVIGCKKDPPVSEPKTSESYLKAHDFYNSGKIEIKENYMPIYNPNTNYEKWEFYELPAPSKGYIYKDLKDTPWIAPTFVSFEVDYNTPQDSVTQKAYDLNYSYNIYDVNGFYIANGLKDNFKPYTASYLVHKTNKSKLLYINGMRGMNQSYKPYWVGAIDDAKKTINFSVYFTDKGLSIVTGLWQFEQLLARGFKEPGDIKLIKQIDNVIFKYYER